ncbi:MAG: YccF domain-containing protein [Paludibacter sp.]|nr:YccF domain-containing protein [Paludibacter sp.]
MKLLGNIIWLLFGGIIISIEYLISSILLMVTIIGIPFGLQTLKLAILALWPFGAEIRMKPGNPGCISTLMNVIWIFIGGIWIALTHLVFGVLFAITIIGIPFALQHFKLAALALTPFGREIV